MGQEDGRHVPVQLRYTVTIPRAQRVLRPQTLLCLSNSFRWLFVCHDPDILKGNHNSHGARGLTQLKVRVVVYLPSLSHWINKHPEVLSVPVWRLIRESSKDLLGQRKQYVLEMHSIELLMVWAAQGAFLPFALFLFFPVVALALPSFSHWLMLLSSHSLQAKRTTGFSSFWRFSSIWWIHFFLDEFSLSPFFWVLECSSLL